MRYIILGTAGHIDHGKRTLVKALTGVGQRIIESTSPLLFNQIYYRRPNKNRY